MTKQQIVKIADAYRKGVPVRDIADQMDFTQEHIYATIRRLRQEGVNLPRRGAGGARKRHFNDALQELKQSK